MATASELEAAGGVPVGGPSELESAARGAVQTGTLGFADELEAYAKELPFVGDPEKRKKLLEGIRKEYEMAQATNPKSYLGGQVAGGVASSFIPGIGIGKNVGLASAIARGAFSSGLSAVGNSTKDINEIANSEEAQKEVLKDAAIGGATAGAGNLVSSGFNKASNLLTAKATGATFNEARQFKPGTIQAIKENKLVPWLGTAEDVAKNTENKLNEVGSAIGDKLRTLNKEGVTVTKDEIVNQLEREGKKLNRLGDVGAKKQLEARKDDLLNLMGNETEVPVTWIQKQKVSISPNSPTWLNPDVAKGDKRVYSGLAKLVAKKAEGLNIGEALKSEQKLYGELAPVLTASTNKALKNQQMVVNGLLDLGVGGFAGGNDMSAGASNMDPVQIAKGIGKGVAAAATRHYVQPRTAGFMSRLTGGVANTQLPEMASRPVAMGASKLFDLYSQIRNKNKTNSSPSY